MTIDDNHLYVPASPGDSRSPCPALNALANHGYLPHDGHNLTESQLATAIRQVYGLSRPLATLLALGGVVRCGHWDGFHMALDLHELAKHDVVEHDASLVHANATAGEEYAPTNVDPALLRQLLDTSDADYLTLKDLCRAQLSRQAASRPLDAVHAYLAKGEVDLMHEAFGVARGSESASGNPAEGGDLVVPKAFLEEWLGREKIPDAWHGPVREIGLIGLVQNVKAISLLQQEIVASGKAPL